MFPPLAPGSKFGCSCVIGRAVRVVAVGQPEYRAGHNNYFMGNLLRARVVREIEYWRFSLVIKSKINNVVVTVSRFSVHRA